MSLSCFEMDERERLRLALSHDPVTAAYLLGDLESPFFEDCRWFVATYRERICGIVLLYSGLSKPCLLSWGAPDAVEAIVHAFACEWPPGGYGKILNAHQHAFQDVLLFSGIERMWNMGLHQDLFEASIPTIQKPNVTCRLLSVEDSLSSILAVYKDYPGHYFEASQLESGVYAGCFVEGVLVGLAGTHTYAPSVGISCLGNIVTATAHRGKGYARVCIAFLVQELQQRGCEHIALNVNQKNKAAIACYRSLGFVFHNTAMDVVFSRVDGELDLS